MAIRILFYSFFVSIAIFTGIAFWAPDFLQWETLEWIYGKRTFFLFTFIFLVSVFLIYVIYRKARKGVHHSKSKTELHLRESLDEIVQDNQSLFSFLKAATDDLEKRLESKKREFPPEYFSACSAEFVKLTREFDSSSEIFRDIPLAPEEDDPKSKKERNFRIFEYSDLINRHRKLSKSLEKLREDVSRLREKVNGR
ncbi:hypothetical protein EHQ12_17375 [Leptospira gomenensis]|uniref:Uncharacterized protein n=1 Tax=Leptospira gomenensis TaxID=2484974 RepID=A0A5F1YZL2_9LEPT|nr:hypothetical protein [Leptospira gomenensis]TGK29467.1 hypothetical protein EHQ17_15960 [Leptospira gomenensis]TGK33630.1 hypothetical protein EHQ12_17375 [Leptospira gomenensis]TGK44871.1 hypothetical protein EHQ07_11330 [Leptospira gomenensis]TGK64492.1 hypothetical protein EHQ13_07415 [Leptospira gomenensis]